MEFGAFENLSLYWHLVILGSFILLLTGFFVFWFWIPSWFLKRDLKQAIEKIKSINEVGQPVNIERIGKEAMASKKMSHLWAEFAETLHPQTVKWIPQSKQF